MTRHAKNDDQKNALCSRRFISSLSQLIQGTTGAGKSQLSIDLARALQGEVINGDSMQVYRGADVLTNKVTKEEMGEVKHNLLGLVDPRQPYDVTNFRRDATGIVPPGSEFTDQD